MLFVNFDVLFEVVENELIRDNCHKYSIWMVYGWLMEYYRRFSDLSRVKKDVVFLTFRCIIGI